MEGKISMSEPLLGAAGPVRSEPALADGNGGQDSAGEARAGAPAGDEPEDGASDEPIDAEKVPKRRRRGSRGGRARRGATVVLVDPLDPPAGGVDGEEASDSEAPAEAVEVADDAVPVVAATVAKPRTAAMTDANARSAMKRWRVAIR